MAITEALDIVRLLIGDTDADAPVLSDEEVEYFIGVRGTNYDLAAADCCEAMAAKYARAYDFETDGQAFKRSQMFAAFRERAAELRNRGRGVTSLEVTKKDGYSDDLDNIESAAVSSARGRQTFYVVGGLDKLP